MDESDEENFKMQMMGITQSLCDKVMEVTTLKANLANIEKWFPIHLERWADAELEVLKESKDLSAPKHKVAAEFAMLWETRRRMGAKLDGDSSRCVCCGGQLSQGLFNENGCLKCAAPVIAAIGDLIRATTDRYSPESVHEYWCMIAGEKGKRIHWGSSR